MNEIIVEKNGTEVFNHEITAFNQTDRVSMQLAGGWINVPLERGTLYNVTVRSEGNADISFMALYEGYWHNSMLNGEGTGLMVTNNSVQFNIVG